MFSQEGLILPQMMLTASYLIAQALLLLLKLHDSSFQRLSEQKVELQTAWGENQFIILFLPITRMMWFIEHLTLK